MVREECQEEVSMQEARKVKGLIHTNEGGLVCAFRLGSGGMGGGGWRATPGGNGSS